MLESVRRGVAAMNATIAGGEPLLGLYIDCAGRGSARSGAPIEEAELVVKGLGRAVPLLGFYSGVEIAPSPAGRAGRSTGPACSPCCGGGGSDGTRAARQPRSAGA
ncbi:FIST C-terminal domain-containing protein [Siccirubricoccus deserti]